jgi:hypothetical protein
MNGRRFVTRLRNVADFLGGVRECSAAAEAGRRPSRAALKAAGIDADAYYSIQR